MDQLLSIPVSPTGTAQSCSFMLFIKDHTWRSTSGMEPHGVMTNGESARAGGYAAPFVVENIPQSRRNFSCNKLTGISTEPDLHHHVHH